MAYDDFEQDERLREWLRHNGVAILVGIVVGLALLFGYRQWTEHKANQRLDAATQYQLIEHAYQAGKETQAQTLTDSLLTNHADSSYAVFAASLRARHQLDAGKTEDAVTSLQWAVQHAKAEPLKALSNLRLARAELAAGKADAALAALQAIGKGDYAAMAAELRGDAQVKLGHTEAAAAAYKEALKAYDPSAPQRRIVQMKIENLAQPAVAATAPAAASSSPKQDT